MNTRTFLKTSLGSLAALTLPFESQAAPLASPTGIPSEFAFGGEFRFGELSLYVHRPEVDIRKFFQSIWRGVFNQFGSHAQIYYSNRYKIEEGYSPGREIEYFPKRDPNVLLMFENVQTEKEMTYLKETALKFPKLSIIGSCVKGSVGLSPYGLMFHGDNIINLDKHPTPGSYTHWARSFKSKVSDSFVREINFRQDESGFKVMSKSSFLA